jgi:hypothetical protein
LIKVLLIKVRTPKSSFRPKAAHFAAAVEKSAVAFVLAFAVRLNKVPPLTISGAPEQLIAQVVQILPRLSAISSTEYFA